MYIQYTMNCEDFHCEQGAQGGETTEQRVALPSAFDNYANPVPPAGLARLFTEFFPTDWSTIKEICSDTSEIPERTLRAALVRSSSR